jgi:hypothetical protein
MIIGVVSNRESFVPVFKSNLIISKMFELLFDFIEFNCKMIFF